MLDMESKIFKGRSILIGLFLLFFLPILVAWFLVFYTDYLPGSKGVQHGVLIKSPRQLEDLQIRDPLTKEIHALYGRWNMLTIIDGDCDQPCINDLYRMRQIRLATGIEAARVQRVVYFSDPATVNRARELLHDFPGQLLLPAGSMDKEHLARFELTDFDPNHAIYLIDPAGFIMMAYPAETDPSGIIRDISRLLRISKED